MGMSSKGKRKTCSTLQKTDEWYGSLNTNYETHTVSSGLSRLNRSFRLRVSKTHSGSSLAESMESLILHSLEYN
ncbi:hypothetical protein TNCV_3654971 [Trichonephila clavipes]|nr:hypothetical protein TNCV_3654971 [Trichonephila clavipes]